MKNLNQIISALMIELIIFLPLTAVAQDVNVTAPTAEDTTPPFINVTIPSYLATNRIDITGTTEPMSTVYLYVNEVKQRKSIPNPQGTFNFLSVDLSPLVPANKIKLESIDPANNVNIKEFTTVVDLTPPKLTVPTEFKELTNISTLLLQGTISEPVKLDITLNNASVLEAENVSMFNQTITLAEGNNLIQIIAADPADNIDKINATMFLDTQPPTITNLTPASGSFFYETATQTDVEGDTEPFAKVELFLETREQDPLTGNITVKREKLGSTEADENGHFKLENVDLFGTTIIPGFLIVGAEAPPPAPALPGLEEEAVPPIAAERPPETTSINLVLVVTDRMGLSAELPLNYRIGTCFAGADWNVINLIEYQSPTSISPERLEEGTELISFILNMSYQGPGTDPLITSVMFERACEGEIVKDNRYKYSCKILPSSPTIRKPNDAKTLWYIRYNLQKLEGINEFTDDIWKDLTKQFKFPLKIKIEYTHKVLNPYTGQYEETRAYQTKCMDIAFHVDTSRIDPRDVLPDWILNDTAAFLNETVRDLDKAIEALDNVIKYVAGACGIMFGIRIIMTIYRRWVSNSEYIQDQFLSKTGKLAKPAPCPKPGAAEFKKIFEEELAEQAKKQAEAKAEGKAFKPEVPTQSLELLKKPKNQLEQYKEKLNDLQQDDLPNNFTKGYPLSEYYNLLTLCPQTHNAWQSEAKAYQAYRWACDRFLCRGSPAEWTGTANFTTIRQKIEKSALCAQETSTQGIILREFPSEDCKFEGKEYRGCWIYKNGVYALAPDQIGEATLELVGGTGKLGAKPAGAPPTIKVTESSGNILFEQEKYEECNKLCTEKNFKEGACLTYYELGQELQKKGTTDRRFESMQQKAKCPDERPICYCLDRKDIVIDPPTPDKWDYRYYRLGYYYDQYKYFKERDQPACFGQDNWLSREAPYLNVGDPWPAFQCLCIPQIRNRLVAAKNFLLGLLNCLQQIRTTGMADAGFCKEVFTQYICKWIYRGITLLTRGCTPWTGIGKDPDAEIGVRVRGGMDAIFGGVQEATNALLEDYDNAALRDYIGVGEGAIAEKICLGALTGDWGFDLEGFIDAAYSQPFHSSVTAWPADREYLTWDPDNEQATYEYRIAWMITPGCDIDRYTVSLACASDYELYNFDGVACEQALNPNADENDNSPSGCDCTSDANPIVNQNIPGPSRVIYTGRKLTQSSYESRSVHSVQTGFQRYDNVKITLYINDPDVAEQCIPSGHLVGKRMGVFYSPITDATTYDILACRFDQTQGYFRCDQGRLLWNLRGRAYFGRVKCDNVPCDEKTYYLNEEIKLSPFEVFVQGQKQCLFMQLFNEPGQKLLGQRGEGLFQEIYPDETDPTKTILVQSLNEKSIKTVTLEDFGKEPATWDTKPTTGHYAKKIEEYQTITDRQEVWIDFRDTSEPADGRADQYLLQGTTEWKDWNANKQVPIGGMYFKFLRQPDVSKKSTCPSESEKPCQRYVFIIKPPGPPKSAKEQKWTLQLELRHAPGNRSQGSCSESRREDLISYQGIPQEQSPKITVKPWTREEDGFCEYTSGLTKNTVPCDCNEDGDKDDDADCDSTTRFFCKNKVCKEVKACLTTGRNMYDCICNWTSGKVEEAKDCRYCYEDSTCHDDPPPKPLAYEAKLTKKITFEFDKTPVSDGMDFLSDLLAIPIELGGRIRRNETLTIRVKDEPFKEVLDTYFEYQLKTDKIIITSIKLEAVK